MKMKNIFKENESIEILRNLDLIENIELFLKWGWRNHKPEFRLRNVNETRNYFDEEIEKNKLMGRKHKKVCATLNYIEHFLF